MCLNETFPSQCKTFNTADSIQKDFGNYAGDSKLNSVTQAVLYIYTLPIFICMGIVGNAIVLYVVRNSVLSRHSVTIYVKAYTVANILSMIFNSSVDWIYIILEVRHFRNNSDAMCRIWQFFIRLVTYSGIWFVVAMATDRYIIVWHGHRKKQLCTMFNAKVTVCLIVVGMVTLSVHAMWTYDFSDEGWCYIQAKSHVQYDFHRLIWPWVSGMLYSLVPILCIFILGNAIVVKQCHQQANNEDKISKELTRTVTFVCFSNFVLNTPATVINILDNALPQSWKEDPYNAKNMEITRDSMILLVCLNYVEILSAFFICSQVFRDTLYKLFHCPRKPESIEGTAV